jgi:hypothetical protein
MRFARFSSGYWSVYDLRVWGRLAGQFAQLSLTFRQQGNLELYLSSYIRSGPSGERSPKGLRDVAQPGSALAWGARGRGFKSRRPDRRKEGRITRKRNPAVPTRNRERASPRACPFVFRGGLLGLCAAKSQDESRRQSGLPFRVSRRVTGIVRSKIPVRVPTTVMLAYPIAVGLC